MRGNTEDSTKGTSGITELQSRHVPGVRNIHPLIILAIVLIVYLQLSDLYSEFQLTLPLF